MQRESDHADRSKFIHSMLSHKQEGLIRSMQWKCSAMASRCFPKQTYFKVKYTNCDSFKIERSSASEITVQRQKTTQTVPKK